MKISLKNYLYLLAGITYGNVDDFIKLVSFLVKENIPNDLNYAFLYCQDAAAIAKELNPEYLAYSQKIAKKYAVLKNKPNLKSSVHNILSSFVDELMIKNNLPETIELTHT